MLWKEAVASDVKPLPDGDVPGAIAMLRAASIRELKSDGFLREELLPTIGLNAEMMHEFPQALYPWCGFGIRSWQYPIQFSNYLAYLSEQNIKSYVEIGCRFGGTFIIIVEYLRRFSDLYHAVALDIESTKIMEDYARQTVGVEYKIADSTAPEMRAYLGSISWDYAFIDGDHTYHGVSTDFESVRQKSKLVGMHDIASTACPDVVKMWREVKHIVPSSRLFESIDQYREVKERTGSTFLGIGVIDFT